MILFTCFAPAVSTHPLFPAFIVSVSPCQMSESCCRTDCVVQCSADLLYCFFYFSQYWIPFVSLFLGLFCPLCFVAEIKAHFCLIYYCLLLGPAFGSSHPSHAIRPASMCNFHGVLQWVIAVDPESHVRKHVTWFPSYHTLLFPDACHSLAVKL